MRACQRAHGGGGGGVGTPYPDMLHNPYYAPSCWEALEGPLQARKSSGLGWWPETPFRASSVALMASGDAWGLCLGRHITQAGQPLGQLLF